MTMSQEVVARAPSRDAVGLMSTTDDVSERVGRADLAATGHALTGARQA
jgi:hypothetical protein